MCLRVHLLINDRVIVFNGSGVDYKISYCVFSSTLCCFVASVRCVYVCVFFFLSSTLCKGACDLIVISTYAWISTTKQYRCKSTVVSVTFM